MSIMAWYPLPKSGGTPSLPGDEFFDNQLSAGWPLWSFGSSADDDHDNHGAGGAREEKHGNGDAAGSSDEHTEGPIPVPQQRTQPTDDIFMSQFSDEEMRRMDAPFEALDMFPGSMHRLLSYENMLSGVLTGSSEDQQDAGLGVDTMDTCGFPLFSHDLMQKAPTELVLPDLVTSKDHHQDGASFTKKRKRSRSVADEGSLFFEALVLQELEDVVFQLTKRTRVCLRDAFFRLAESSRAKCSAANGAPSSESGVQQAADGNASRMSTPGCPERETNAIDRTVADLTMKPPGAVPLEVLVSRCPDEDSGVEAQSATTSSWTTTA
ncbi:protein LNK3-like isoform X1 [Miscanthus floridulus]|uniref:protein LNK3-like isoform X1 n=1 Tax=Miscanthus floridulus TaxID=154761 RepID=UPI003459690C